MVTVYSTTFSGVGSTRVAFVNADTLTRPLPFGHEWSQARVGFRFINLSASGTPTPASDVPFFFGLDASTADYGYPNNFNTDPTGSRAVGLWVGNPHRTGNTPRYDNIPAKNLVIDQTGNTVNASSQLAVAPRFNGATSTSQALILQFTRGSFNLTVEALFLNTTATAITEATFDSAMNAATMSAAQSALGATYTLETHTLAGAIARDADGRLDRICLSYGFNPEWNGQEVGFQKFSARRLY